MAESQVAYPYDPAGIAALRASISAPRFGPYLSMAGRDERYALALYLYNARLAKSFLYPLHMAEVTLRNAIVDALATEFGPDWPSDGAFRAMLTPGGTATLDKARERVTADKGPNFPVSQLVATLTFDFWSNLFRPHYYLPFWQRHLRTVLPHLPAGEGRHEAQARVREINRFRNRIAHHEPILKADATATHKGILDLARPAARPHRPGSSITRRCTRSSVAGRATPEPRGNPSARSATPPSRRWPPATASRRRSPPSRPAPSPSSSTTMPDGRHWPSGPTTSSGSWRHAQPSSAA